MWDLLKSDDNKHFDKEVEIREELSLDTLGDSSRNGDVLHFVGHSTRIDNGTDSDNVNDGAVLTQSDDGNLLKVPDVTFSCLLAKLHSIHTVKLVFLSVCDKFDLHDPTSNGRVAVKLQKALYGRAQSARAWRGHLSDFLLKIGFEAPYIPFILLCFYQHSVA